MVHSSRSSEPLEFALDGTGKDMDRRVHTQRQGLEDRISLERKECETRKTKQVKQIPISREIPPHSWGCNQTYVKNHM